MLGWRFGTLILFSPIVGMILSYFSGGWRKNTNQNMIEIWRLDVSTSGFFDFTVNYDTSIVLFWGFWPMIDTPLGVSRTNLCLGGMAVPCGESGGKISIRLSFTSQC